MKNNITILVDDRRDCSPYIVCSYENGRYVVIEKGVVSDSEQLRNVQVKFNADLVKIDCAFMGSSIQHAACNYDWELIKFKNTDFPYIEAIINLSGVNVRP